MPIDQAYVRRASGLVRGLSQLDAFAVGLTCTFVQPIYAIWYVLIVGEDLFPRGNLLIALGLSVVVGGASVR